MRNYAKPKGYALSVDYIAREVSYATGVTRKDVRKVYSALLEVIKQALINGVPVVLNGIGTFNPVESNKKLNIRFLEAKYSDLISNLNCRSISYVKPLRLLKFSPSYRMKCWMNPDVYEPDIDGGTGSLKPEYVKSMIQKALEEQSKSK